MFLQLVSQSTRLHDRINYTTHSCHFLGAASTVGTATRSSETHFIRPQALNTGLLMDRSELQYVVHPPCHVRLSGRPALA